MKLDWYFDFISPFSYLQLERFGELPPGTEVRLRPILFGALLDAWGHKGPAEIPAKRVFTYRMVQWSAERLGIPLRFPPAHPFNPIRCLRLAVALGSGEAPVREIFRFIWREGRDPGDAAAWSDLAARMGIHDSDAMIARPAVKDELRRNGEEALARGVFGVPTFALGGDLFWGCDATEMMLACLRDPGLLQRGEMARIARLPVGVQRKASG